MTDIDSGRRDRKKALTRGELRRAALTLVAERGFANVTVEDIADAADVSPRTFFNYVPSKEAAVVGEDPESLNVLVDTFVDFPAEASIVDAVRALIRIRCERFARDAGDGGHDPLEHFRQMKIVHADPQLRAALVGHLETYERRIVEGIAQRLGVDAEIDPYPALLATAAMGSIRVAIMYWARSGGMGSPVELAERAFTAYAQGLPFDGAFATSFNEMCTSAPPHRGSNVTRSAS